MDRNSENGKFLINGEEIYINYEDDVPLETLKRLESQPVSQLDVFYIRKNLHSLNNFIQGIAIKSDVESAKSIQRHNDIVNSEHTIYLEIDRKVKEVSKEVSKEMHIIANKTVHNIVNGKFVKIENMFEELKNMQLETATIVQQHAKNNEEHFNLIHERIEYTINKTIFGWFKNQYEEKPLKSILYIILSSVVLFMLIAQLYHLNIGTDALSIIKKILDIK